MCRIAGLISNQFSSEKAKTIVTQMCNLMHKGGPDGEGILHIPQLNLTYGHRRLSLIDLSENGKQPMAYQNHLWITFNGEIYNYRELKADLTSKGHHFKNETDTEVILAGYKEYNTAFFNQLKGMFAFSLTDTETEKTYLVRDHLGIKPLYYYQNSTDLYFASEVKAFYSINNNWKTNSDWPIYFLSFGYIPEPYTTFKDIFNLQKGHYLTWDHQQKKATITKFANEYPQIKSDLNPIEETKKALDLAVKRHLISDAPIGVFLSGGIDSSLLSIIANQYIEQQITTISINFNEPEFSEEHYQKIIAQQINSKHISHTVKNEDFNIYIDQIFEDMDQPSNDGVNSWFVNKVAKDNGLKAVLSGIGADEIFGGYPSFKRHKLISKLKKLPPYLLKLAKYLPNDKLKRISFLAYNNPIGEYLFLRGFYTPNIISKLLNVSENKIHQLLNSYILDNELKDLTAENRISWFETNVFMQNQLLKDTDYMSMAHGVEVRVPFLDQDLLNLALQLPIEQRFNQQPKSLLINAYKNILPEEIWNRPKKGFTFPFQQWFTNYKPMLDEKHYQNNNQAINLVKQFKNNKLHWSKLFAVYQVFKHAK